MENKINLENTLIHNLICPNCNSHLKELWINEKEQMLTCENKSVLFNF